MCLLFQQPEHIFFFDTIREICERENPMEILYAVLWSKAEGDDIQPLTFPCA